jgi:hypothetical protein
MRRIGRIKPRTSTIWILSLLCVAAVALEMYGNLHCAWMDGDTRKAISIEDGQLQWSAFPHWPYLDIKPEHDPAPKGIPLSVIAILFGLIPFLRGVETFQTRRRALARLRGRKRGRSCSSCHYDLTANVSGVCPECGMKIAEAK